MLPETQSNSEPEIEPIHPEQAEILLREAMEPYLADGWHLLRHNAYTARLTRGTRNMDIFVDLLGQIETQESGLTPLQDSGRLVAWVILLAALLIVLSISAALGII